MFTMELNKTQIFYIILYTTISVAAIGGNGIVIYLIARYKQMRSVTNVFILNLAIGDLLMAVLCIPFTFTPNLLLYVWPFGALMCRVVSYAQAVSVFISAYTLVAISVDRYIAILYPLRSRMTRRHSLYLIAFIWLVALLTPLPTALFSRIEKKGLDSSPENSSTFDQVVETFNVNEAPRTNYSIFQETQYLRMPSFAHDFNNWNNNVSMDSNANIKNDKWTSSSFPTNSPTTENNFIETNNDNNSQPEGEFCNEDWSWAGEDLKVRYSLALMILQYGLPFSVLVYTYTRIACVVWGKQTPGEAQEERDTRRAAAKRKMIKMMITCVVTFTLCWLPFNILIVVGDSYNVYEYEHIEYVWFACHWLAMSHACYNPIIYIWMNARFRYGFRLVLSHCCPCLLPDQQLASSRRSLANIFGCDTQRQRALSNYYHCHTYTVTEVAGQSVLYHGTNHQLLHNSHRTSKDTLSSNSSKSPSKKRLSLMGNITQSSSGISASNGNAKIVATSDMTKSHSFTSCHPLGTINGHSLLPVRKKTMDFFE